MTTTAAHTRFPLPLSWLPLVALLALLVVSALSGYGGVARDAHASNTITVTGLVNKLVYLDASGCAASSALDLGDLVPDDPWKRTTSDCSILFGSSNSGAGADLTVLEDPGAPASPADAMKCTVASCGASALDDVAANSAPPASSASAFGAQLESASGLATAGWTVSKANPIAAASTACSTAAIGDGTCSFRFGASANSGDGPGVYQAQVQFLVLAR
jgi:hypothetical protein